MNDISARIRTSLSAGLFFFGLYALLPSFFVCLLFSLACWMLMVEWPRVRGELRAFTFLYPLVPLILLIVHVVQWRAVSPWYGLYPFIAAWLVDVVAYFVGSRWGVHHCWPTISPRKTWEGVVGGVVALCLLHLVLCIFHCTTYPWWYMMTSAVVVAMVAMLGDLIMSWYKRQEGLKDTGGMLPGHGGLLDRFDSVLAVIVLLKAAEVIPGVL
ncbi:MAG: phosphatidate cytidylyltransferase [Candidatus Dependentiae bacterium]|nr:phosphatidate cytidylyltransferase [Candidatus Dependentiae bacterium]